MIYLVCKTKDIADWKQIIIDKIDLSYEVKAVNINQCRAKDKVTDVILDESLVGTPITYTQAQVLQDLISAKRKEQETPEAIAVARFLRAKFGKII